jgi:glucose/arabinose dehydrogenase
MMRRAIVMIISVVLALIVAVPIAFGQTGPTMLVDDLGVRTITSGLATPVSMAFLGRDDMLVLEKNTGKVERVQLQRDDTGQVVGRTVTTVLDLPVNLASERGLLGIALHPNFPTNPGVYLYWTESTTRADSDVFSEVPLLGNRVDRFVWDGSSLTFDQNLIKLRAYQADDEQPLRGNNDGGVIRFGPDRKLYIIVGDVGRRGQMQNLKDGPFGPGILDDRYGGPEPDDAHLTSVILRLNDDGTTPSDNPFFAAGARIGGEAGANIQKIFAYGIRNSFGMDFDPRSGNLWTQENSDDAFDELNLVQPGLNSGWVQIMGPVSRIREVK